MVSAFFTRIYDIFFENDSSEEIGTMLSDIQIAQQAVLKPITKIAQELGIEEEELEPTAVTKPRLTTSFSNG